MTDKRAEVQSIALKTLQEHKRAGVGLSMGVGKTYVGLQHMLWYLATHNSEARFLVVAPKRSIFQSWIDDAYKFGISNLLGHITFTTYLSLEKQSREFDVVYLDECHSLTYKHSFWLDTFMGSIVGLTGTPPRHAKSEKGEMVGKFCPIRYAYITDDAVEAGILNDYKIVIHSLPLSRVKNMRMSTKSGKSWMTSEDKQYEYWNEKLAEASTPQSVQWARIMRMRALMEFPSKETYAKNLLEHMTNKCLVFCNTQDQADRICVHSYHSTNPESDNNLENFKLGNIDKLSCVLQLNEGINIPDLKSGIIMHAYSNERKSSQRIGRLLRLNPTETATIHILMYADTVDEMWVQSALEGLDSSKIIYSEPLIF